MAQTAHPSFDQPGDQQVAIWRYLDREKFVWLVENGRLFMPCADKLGDPWEGTMSAGELSWWEQTVLNAETEEARAIHDHNRTFMSHMVSNVRSHHYVSCWHMNKYENYAMWSAYTNTENAVAIKTSYSNLVQAIPEYFYTGLVRYADYYDDKKIMKNLFDYIMHKDTGFQSESEIRAVGCAMFAGEAGEKDFNAMLFVSESDPDLRVCAPLVDVQKLVEGVVLHPDASDLFTQEMNDLCLRAGLPKPEMSRRREPPALLPNKSSDSSRAKGVRTLAEA